MNKHLLHEWTAAGIGTESVRNRITANRGSVEHVTEILQEMQDVYYTVWEIVLHIILNGE